MEAIWWILAIVVAAAVAWAVGASRTRSRYETALQRLARNVERGVDELSEAGAELPGVAGLRARLQRLQDDRTAPPRSESVPAERPSREAKAAAAPDAEEDEELVHSVLSRIRSYLEGGVEEPLREAVGEGDDALRTGVEDALVAVEDLYFYLREVPEARQPEDLNMLAREAADEYRDEWKVDVDVHVPERPTMVEVNREAMLDALYLVLHNAGTFGEARDVQVVVRYQDGDCWLVVRDRGEGFGNEALERAFEPFYTTTHLGLGLGLYQVRKIIRTMGGTVAVRNRRGGGGQVEIVLPEAEGEGE